MLIHGLSGSEHWWRYTVPALEREFTVYTLELSGYGRARRSRSQRVHEVARLISAWLEAADLRDVTLVGHSMGGHISLHVSAQSPARVTSLVLACASGLLRGRPVRTALHLPRAAVAARKSFLGRVMYDALRAGPLNLWASTSDLLRDSVEDVLPFVYARTLVVWGGRDALVPLPLGRELASRIAGAQFEVIPQAGHIVMVDAPARFNRLLLDFLDTAVPAMAPAAAQEQSA